MKKSHMDQKVRPYVVKAIEAGCEILEIDVQSACGVIVLGHDWRPKLPFLFDCTLADYMKRVPAGIIIQLDIKEICFTEWGRRRFADRIRKVLEPYRKTHTFLISANEGLFRKDTCYRVYLDMVYFQRFEAQLWEVWKQNKNIEVVDLWAVNQ